MKNDIRNLYWPGLYNVFVFIIVLEACLKLRADLTNIPTSGRASQLSRAPKTACIAVKSYINVGHKQLFSCLDRKSK